MIKCNGGKEMRFVDKKSGAMHCENGRSPKNVKPANEP
jgi:hypothetical protein